MSTELAFSLNVCIVCMFWSVVAPLYIENWDKWTSTATGRMALFELTFVHVTPMVLSIIQICTTDMVWLKKDSIYSAIAGMVYIFFDLAGLTVHGVAMYNYPGLNWANFWLTFLVYMI